MERRGDLDAIKAKLLGTAGAGVGVVGARRGAAVQGMGGVGKTMLAADVIEDRDVRAAFPDGIVWLTLGQTPDLLGLQRRLLAWVASDTVPPTEVQAGRDALDTALKSRRWLIILDDVWQQSDLRPFEVADTPSRLLITTRDEAIVRASGALPHVVEELTEPAARALLAEAIGLTEHDLPLAAADRDSVNGVVVLADGARALSWSEDGTLRLWDLASGTGRVLEGHRARVSGAVLADGVSALSWSEDRTLRLWDFPSGTDRVLEGHHARVGGAVVLTDGARALSWSEDGTLRLWDLASGASRVLEGHRSVVDGAVVLADGARALSWSWDRTLRLWDLTSGASRALEGHRDIVYNAVVLADGARALSWSEDGTLRLWDLASGASRALEGHRASVCGALVLADGARALSWSFDSTLRLWDLATLRNLTRFVGDDPLTCCIITQDERLAIAGDSRGRVLRFDSLLEKRST